MWDSFDPRERTICGIATVTSGRGAVAKHTNGVVVSVQCGVR